MKLFDKLFIFEMANNHMGDVEHGLKVIREIYEVSKNFELKFAFKFQFRDLDTFIHPDYKDRKDIKYVKRFSETRLSIEQLKTLKDEIDKLGFISICTPFDEKSVDLIEELNFSVIKIASCSFLDWPLLERIVKSDKPIIASTAGVELIDIDKVVSFFEHRKKEFALMHCVAEYPTKDQNLELNQIDVLKKRYARIPVGYSSHEDPENLSGIKIAIAKGAQLFERHVGVGSLNAYSSSPEIIKKWLESANQAFLVCGREGERSKFSEQEKGSLKSLARGAWANRDIAKGEKISPEDIFLAIPTQEGQLVANDLSKYLELYTNKGTKKNQPVILSDLKIIDNRKIVYKNVQKIKKVLQNAKISVPGELGFEISHHYGVERFAEIGCTLINFINRDYCKKLIVLLPGQKHPEQYHQKKEETFHVLSGDVLFKIDGKEQAGKPGDIITIECGVKHAFESNNGAVIEEISSTHFKDDSFYTDPKILENKARKTFITYWMD